MEVHGKIDAPKYLIEGVDVTNKIKNLPADTQAVLDSKLNKNAPIIAGTNTKVTYDTNGLVVSSSSLVSSDIPNLDASKITTGTIDINRLPNGALPELIIVANQSARFALTTSQVQNGDTVKQTDNNLLYYVKDQTNLSNSNGYEVYSATTDWSLINSKPQNILDISSISKNNDDIIQVKSGIYTNRTPGQFKSDLLLSKSDIGLSNVDDTSDATKNVLSATKLTTARTINGTSFDGTANITVADSTKQPLNSSLTSISSLSLVGNQNKAILVNTNENGFVLGAISNANNLGDLTDVDTIGLANYQVLLYTNGKWENKPITDCLDLFGADGKIPLSKVSVNTINIRGTWNATTNMTTPKGGGVGSALTSGTATDGYVWIVQTAGNTVLDGYSDWAVNDWVYGNGITWVKLANGASVTSVNGQTGSVELKPNNLTLSTGNPISGTVGTGDGLESAILKLKNSLNNISAANKPTLSYLLNASDIIVSGTGTSVNVSWTTQSNAVRYKVFLKQTSSGTINIISDSPAATITAPTNYTTLSVTQGVQYSYAVVAEITVDNAVNVSNYTTQTSINNFTVDTFDLSAGTTASLSWGSVVGATEYRVSYQRAISLTSPTIISGITGTSRTITGLTVSDPLDVNTDYSFKVEAYNSGGSKIAESSVVTRPVFDRIKLKLFSDAAITIGVTSISRSGTVATVVTSSSHGLIQGDVVSITGSVSPFNVTYALVSTIVSGTSFTYTVVDTGSASTTSATLQKFPNSFITWNYYKSLQYLNYLETTTVKAIPYTADIYKNFASYTSNLIFSSTKYSYTGDAYAGWYLVKPYTSDGERYVLTDTNGNSALMMFSGNISYADRMDKFLFTNDDHRSYKVWHGGGTYLANDNINTVNGQNWFKLNPDLSQNNTASYISPLPNNLYSSGQAMPATLLISGYTVWFDNDNQRLTWIHKSGSRQTSIAFSTLGIGNLFGFTIAAGGGTLAINGGWYVMHDNVNRIVIGNRANASIGCWRITINFEAGTAVATSMTRMSNNNFVTEEDAFGSEIVTYFNLSNNTVQAIYHASYSAPNVTFALTPNMFTGNPDSYSTTTATIYGDMNQPGSNPVTMIAVDGNVYFVDWGHDDRGMYRPTGNDDGLGVVRVVNCTVHSRLLSVI